MAPGSQHPQCPHTLGSPAGELRRSEHKWHPLATCTTSPQGVRARQNHLTSTEGKGVVGMGWWPFSYYSTLEGKDTKWAQECLVGHREGMAEVWLQGQDGRTKWPPSSLSGRHCRNTLSLGTGA